MSTRRPRGRDKARPFHGNRFKTQKKVVPALVTQSPKTGINHIFFNPEAFEAQIAQFEQQQKFDQTQLYRSLPFNNWLQGVTVDRSHLKAPIDVEGFRYADPKFGPITVAGNLGDGGRFNIGSAQMNAQFPNLKKFGCLYLASSKECAEAEAARPLGVFKMYRVKATRPLELWDLSKVIEELQNPGLLEVVKESHGDRLYPLIKVPLVSQILGHRLKTEGGDGIQFGSTKMDGHLNIALFFDTDAKAAEALTAEQI